jgi:hypothetical protein
MNVMTIVDKPEIALPNVSIGQLIELWEKKEAFKKKERERLAKAYYKKVMAKAGVSTLEEYKKLKDTRGCKMKYFTE